MHPRVVQFVSVADASVKIVGFVGIVVALLATAAGYAKPAVRDFVGHTELAKANTKIASRISILTERVSALEKPKQIVKFDMHRTRRYVSTCAIGDVCSMTVVMNRTRHGKDCGVPQVTPYIINGGGLKHSAEYRGHAPSADHMMWTSVRWTIVIPKGATPGDADLEARIEWSCPFGDSVQVSPLVPVIITAPVKDAL